MQGYPYPVSDIGRAEGRTVSHPPSRASRVLAFAFAVLMAVPVLAILAPGGAEAATAGPNPPKGVHRFRGEDHLAHGVGLDLARGVGDRPGPAVRQRRGGDGLRFPGRGSPPCGDPRLPAAPHPLLLPPPRPR